MKTFFVGNWEWWKQKSSIVHPFRVHPFRFWPFRSGDGYFLANLQPRRREISRRKPGCGNAGRNLGRPTYCPTQAPLHCKCLPRICRVRPKMGRVIQTYILRNGPRIFPFDQSKILRTGMLKNIFHTIKICTVQNFQIFLNSFCAIQSCPKNSFGPVQKMFVLECRKLF